MHLSKLFIFLLCRLLVGPVPFGQSVGVGIEVESATSDVGLCPSSGFWPGEGSGTFLSPSVSPCTCKQISTFSPRRRAQKGLERTKGRLCFSRFPDVEKKQNLVLPFSRCLIHTANLESGRFLPSSGGREIPFVEPFGRFPPLVCLPSCAFRGSLPIGAI